MSDLPTNLRSLATEVCDILWQRRTPRLRIPANEEDTDLRISRTLTDAAARIEALERTMSIIRAENEVLRGYFFKTGGMEDAPCLLCGYNGPHYFHPGHHPCAAEYHAAMEGRDDDEI